MICSIKLGVDIEPTPTIAQVGKWLIALSSKILARLMLQ